MPRRNRRIPLAYEPGPIRLTGSPSAHLADVPSRTPFLCSALRLVLRLVLLVPLPPFLCRRRERLSLPLLLPPSLSRSITSTETTRRARIPLSSPPGVRASFPTGSTLPLFVRRQTR